ncbi:HAMP domain-containing protein [Paenibacillus sp. H1-7]|uniref:sensor histidine kinase n=1 Tax=Paenibacillus sp. H1-7 TaxID=2282849 RepID=UPI001EF99894|nr:sensor histidine kinase [Paenibacillus sp. H1-7]ULL13461.1 HAMP domain-containing protein [Paenibacillus sp. H1-7]
MPKLNKGTPQRAAVIDRLGRCADRLRSAYSFWRKSFKWKLVSIFALIVFANLLVIGFFVSREAAFKIQEDDMKFSSLVLKQANLNLERYLGEYERFLLTLGSSEQLQSWSSLSVDRQKQSVVPFYVLESDFIKPFVNSHPEMISVVLFHQLGNQAYITTELGIKPGYRMSDEPWFQSINPIQRATYIAEITSDYVDTQLNEVRLPVISIIKRVGFNGATYIKLDIKPDLMQSILNEMNIGKNGVGFITNGSGTIVAHPKRELLQMQMDADMQRRIGQADSGSFIHPGTNEIVVYRSIHGTDWKSVIVIPYVEVAGSVYEIRNIIMVTAAICLAASGIFIVLVSTSVTRRISVLKQRIKQTGHGNIDAPIEVEGEDEISALAQSYNEMLSDLQQHIKRLAEARLAEQQAVLFSLQSQIDSHFLYNTLEIINSMATKIRHNDIEQITISLAHMFRYTANFRQTDVTLEQEVQHLKRYLQIIQIRYGDAFAYTLTMDNACKEVHCLKVILQPIAENAVRHGFEMKAKRLKLTIRILRNESGWVEVYIADDGMGFDPDRLAELTQRLGQAEEQNADFTRIGLLNIQHRLNMRYNRPDAKLTIGNNPGGGAYVKMTFPAE